jgi:hypothetical protein
MDVLTVAYCRWHGFWIKFHRSLGGVLVDKGNGYFEGQ